MVSESSIWGAGCCAMAPIIPSKGQRQEATNNSERWRERVGFSRLISGNSARRSSGINDDLTPKTMRRLRKKKSPKQKDSQRLVLCLSPWSQAPKDPSPTELDGECRRTVRDWSFVVTDLLRWRFCFGFNWGKCDACQPGDKCPKGLRKCMKPGCSANHAYVRCPTPEKA